MTLALELGGIHDPAIRRNFETISQQFPVVATGGGGGGGAPSGPAGGDLTGTYPNPGIAPLVIVNGDISATAAIARAKLDFGSGLVNADIAAGAAIAKAKLAALAIVNADVDAAAAIAESKLNLATDAAAGVGSRRTLGTGATQAAAGNDSRLSDSRAPNGSASGDLTGTYPGPTIAALAVTDAKVAAANKDGLATTPSMRTLGTGGTQAAAGNDSRLSDARTPTAHQSTHQSGNSDALTGNLDAVGRSNISKGGTLVAARRGLNLIEGTSVTITAADNAGSERVDVTINASGGGGGVVAMDTWHTVGGAGEPAFQNSWGNYIAATHPVAAFTKDPFGHVHVRGLVTKSAGAGNWIVGDILFTLPVGYRPPTPGAGGLMIFDCEGKGGTTTGPAQVQVDNSGNVKIGERGGGTANPVTYLDLAEIEFDTGSVSTLTFGGSAFVSQAKWFTD